MLCTDTLLKGDRGYFVRHAPSDKDRRIGLILTSIVQLILIGAGLPRRVDAAAQSQEKP